MNLNATIFGQIISFILFVWFCMKYVWSPLIVIIEKRQTEISNDLASARCAKIESDRVNSEALVCLQEAKIRAQEIINHANVCKTHILNEAKYEADRERNRILSQTRLQVIREKDCVIEELKKGIGRLVIEATEKIIDCSIDRIQNDIFVDGIIEKLFHDKDKI